MKLTIAGLAAFAATKVYANYCSNVCGAACAEDGEESELNWNKAGFESVEECSEHQCSDSNHGFTEAQWHECEMGSRELEERKFNHIVKMSYQMIKRQGAGTTLSYRELHKKLQNYGCHCFPGQSRATIGKGPTVDAQDGLCRDLARCHRCVSMDHNSRPGHFDVVDPSFAKYRFKIVDNDVSCQRNTDKGKHQSLRDLCECDAKFAREIAAIWTDASYNRYFWHFPKSIRKQAKGKELPAIDQPDDYPKFDFDGTCVGSEGGQADSCCGTYPDRLPFDSASKSCCQNNSLYNNLLQTCCNDGRVANAGDC